MLQFLVTYSFCRGLKVVFTFVFLQVTSLQSRSLTVSEFFYAKMRTPKSEEEALDGIEGEEGSPEGGEAPSDETATEE